MLQVLLRPLLGGLFIAILGMPVAARAQDEPGAPSSSGEVPSELTTPSSAPVSTSRVGKGREARLAASIDAARSACRPGKGCALTPKLLGALYVPSLATRALSVLGQIGEPRAVMPVINVIRFGDPSLRRPARAALVALARVASSHAALARVAATSPDPATRAVAAAALREAGGGPGTQKRPAQVRDLSDEDERDVQRGREAKGEHAAQRAAPDVQRASDPTRVVFGSSALTRRPKSWAWSVYNLGAHFVDYTVNEHVEVGMGVGIPAMVYGFMPRVKLVIHPRPTVHLGLLLTGGAFGSFALDNDNRGVGVYGGGPIITLGDERLFFNASFLFGGRSTYGDKEYCSYSGHCGGDNDDTAWLAMASVGVSWRVGNWVRLNASLHMPLHQGFEDNAKTYVFFYGVRIFGKHLFGDIAMMMLFNESTLEIFEYMPLGIPFLSFGYQWS
ncbi:MAG: hypothetical protein KAI47_12750 [Deltaproteobacteria bacterium]|nr:hypothetical protein [Deltaproteobacteria bacterium]